MTNKKTLVAACAIIIGLAGCAEFKDAGRSIGHGTRDAAKSVGHGTRDAAKAVGHGTARVWDEATADGEGGGE
ncbi:hypothetical protein EDC56_2345 [Sinobacterium caligoides]|uniref:Uncharacterized protein n=1 Tax=Sinobacterium caligoides TaxID=933926 RepID=A0A3N2DQ06_9GAMM|nr:hypothetical protein [Sinobacterium caligoides]ROS01896.1 hypothetical protein EDC56_2345 [Sinobacterium caligoides]